MYVADIASWGGRYIAVSVLVCIGLGHRSVTGHCI